MSQTKITELIVHLNSYIPKILRSTSHCKINKNKIQKATQNCERNIQKEF